MTTRKRLPKKRKSHQTQARIDGHKLYITMGEYPDGMLGEVFLDMHKVGATFRGMMHCFAQLLSIALQYGVPLRVIVSTFRGREFEPCGEVVGHPRIEKATSLVDYVVRCLACEYLDEKEPEDETT